MRNYIHSFRDDLSVIFFVLTHLGVEFFEIHAFTLVFVWCDFCVIAPVGLEPTTTSLQWKKNMLSAPPE